VPDYCRARRGDTDAIFYEFLIERVKRFLVVGPFPEGVPPRAIFPLWPQDDQPATAAA
jgi:hypothetical protein